MTPITGSCRSRLCSGTSLVINALKHAFPQERSGKISVDYRSHGQDRTLSVSDDGIGMGDSAAKAGLGTGIVEALARNLKSDISVPTESLEPSYRSLTLPTSSTTCRRQHSQMTTPKSADAGQPLPNAKLDPGRGGDITADRKAVILSSKTTPSSGWEPPTSSSMPATRRSRPAMPRRQFGFWRHERTSFWCSPTSACPGKEVTFSQALQRWNDRRTDTPDAVTD